MNTCETCRYGGPPNYDDRQCRRRSPVMDKVEYHIDLRGYIPAWPRVKFTDWCGDHAETTKGPQ